MHTDPCRVELTLHDDPRLMAAVRAVVSHAAERAGLPSEVQEGFAAAAVDACRETFPLVNGNGGHDSTLKMVVADFHDRVEVMIEHSGEALPTAGLDTFCGGGAKGAAESISNSLQDTRVDRVQYETSDGHSRMTLIKYRKGDRAAV